VRSTTLIHSGFRTQALGSPSDVDKGTSQPATKQLVFLRLLLRRSFPLLAVETLYASLRGDSHQDNCLLCRVEPDLTFVEAVRFSLDRVHYLETFGAEARLSGRADLVDERVVAA
jgi:hypothetical protein